MTGSGGGVGAAFGFRYQYLLTVEVLLDLFAGDSTDWSVTVDPVSQDSADIVVHRIPRGSPERVMQVKASLPESSTTIGITAVKQILNGLCREHPTAGRREIITNRTHTLELTQELAKPKPNMLNAGEYFDQRSESSQQLTEKLLGIIASSRAAGPGGAGRELHYMLLRQLVDRVHEAGARTHDQSILYEDVRSIIEGSNQLVSGVLGSRTWGKCIQVPTGDYIERPGQARFLETELPSKVLYEGSPRIAVLKGLSGTGKSASAFLHAMTLIEHAAFVLWLDASSPATLESQIPMVFEQLGVSATSSENTSSDLLDLLTELPVPWVLVLDGASSPAEIDSWVPRSGFGQIILTTQDVNWPSSFAPAMKVDAFSKSEARNFVARRLRKPIGAWSTEQLEACDTMAQSLARWPLALELAIGWIIRHGGSIAAMQQFADRVDRLDLDDETLLPHGYPRTAARAVLSQWEEMSSEAQWLATYLLMMGGSRVPSVLLHGLVARHGKAAAALEELSSSAFIRQEIIDLGQPREIDEVVTIHGFVQLVMEQYGVVIDGATICALTETIDEDLRRLTEGARFREGALLVRPLDHLLTGLVQSNSENTAVLFMLSILMHNLAQLSVITSHAKIARRWSRIAFNVRPYPPSDLISDQSAWAQMQLQTLSLVAVTAAHLRNSEDIAEVGNLTESLLRYVDNQLLSDAETTHALTTLRDVLDSYFPASSPDSSQDVVARLNCFIPQDAPAPSVDGAGNALITLLQKEVSTAVILVGHSAWQAGVDLILAAANKSLEEGAMVDQLVDELLFVGRSLLIEATRRPMETPDLLFDSIKRLVVWLGDNPTVLDATQQGRYLVLCAFLQDDPGAFSAAVEKFPSAEGRSPQLSDWATLARIIEGQREAMGRRSMFDNPPEFVSVTQSIDGGGRLNVWWRDTESSVVELWVHAPDVVTITSSGRSDPVREGMKESGLWEISQGDAALLVEGWYVKVDGIGIEIYDAHDICRAEVEDISEEISRRITENGGLILVYGDLPVVPPTERILGGWVPLTGSDLRSRHDSDDQADLRSSRWRRRIFFWRS